MGNMINKYQMRVTVDKTSFIVGKIPPAIQRALIKKYNKEHNIKPDIADFHYRLYRFGKISYADYIYYNGVYYGYPKCCIRFYIYCLLKLRVPPYMYMTALYGTDTDKVGYVRCPKCRKERR